MNKELLNTLIKKAANLEQTTIQVENFAFHAQDFEKFAELIVEECISVVEDQFWSDPHEVYQALDLIKKHFGVN